MTFTDLNVDSSALSGQRVEATGVLQQIGQIVMLKESLFSMNGVFVEIEALSRNERRRIYQMCAEGCTATVQGRSATVMMNPGINAERVEIP